MLPEVRLVVGGPRRDGSASILGRSIPIAGCAGDQQAATFGQGCLAAGATKVTYGTGAFLLMNTGARPVVSANGLLSTVGWRLGPTERRPSTRSKDRRSSPVPRSSGCATASGPVATRPRSRRWPTRSRHRRASTSSRRSSGSVRRTGTPTPGGRSIGLTRGTGLAEISRAAIDAMAYQVTDVVAAMALGRGDRARRPPRRRRSGPQRSAVPVPGRPPRRRRSNGPSTPRPPRSVRPAWPASASGSGPTRAHSSATRAVDRRFEPAMTTDRRERLAPRLASGGRAIAELGRAGRLTDPWSTPVRIDG